MTSLWLLRVIEFLALLSLLANLMQARLQWRRAVRIRGAKLASVTLFGSPIISLGLVLLFTRFGSVIAAIVMIALTLIAAWLAYLDRRRWRKHLEYRLGLLSLSLELLSCVLIIIVIAWL